jgi:branched-chain amino acid transport system permease protein
MQEFLQHTLNGLSTGSIYALVALGYTMVYGILQMINFAHSEIYMLGAFAVYYCARWFGLDTPSILNFSIGLMSAILICGMVGMMVERFAYKPLRKTDKLNVLITAIGVSILFQFGGQIIFGADPKSFPTLIEDKVIFDLAGINFNLIDILIYGVTFSSLIALSYLVNQTQRGRAMRAVSTKPDAAKLMGINNDSIISFTFMVGSILAGIGAFLVATKYPKIEPMMGARIGMSAFVAAVFGGIGNLPGAVLGGYLLGLGEYYLIGYGASTYREALSFFILIIILLIKPNGLLGKTTKEKI